MTRLARMASIALALVLPAGGAASPEAAVEARLRALVAEQGLSAAPEAGLSLATLDDPVAALGRELFFAKSLSGSLDVACASCHHPFLAGGDALSLPIGVHAARPEVLGLGRVMNREVQSRFEPSAIEGPNVPRNSPTTFNSGLYRRALFHDGRVELGARDPADASSRTFLTPDSVASTADPEAGATLLAAQSRFPVASVHEMLGFEFARGLHIRNVRDALMARLAGGGGEPRLPRNEWLARFREAFARPQGTVDELVTFANVTVALARYQESQRFVDNPWFRYVRGDAGAITAEQKQGALLFYAHPDAGGCSSCHRGDHLTDEDFHNLAFPSIGIGKDKLRQDYGRKRVTREEGKKFAFRTPSLLNVEMTAPYGHAGTFATLSETLEHHVRPEESLAAFDYRLRRLPQLALSGIEYARAQLNTEIVAAQPNRARVHPYSPEELRLIESFLAALTDPCTRSAACLAPWIPDPGSESPDGTRLEARFLRLPAELSEPPDTLFEEVSAAIGIDHAFAAPSVAPERDVPEAGTVHLGRNQHLLMASGLAAGDVDADGHPDLLLLGGKLGATKLYLSRGDGTFRDATAGSGIEVRGNVNGATFADLDGDGRLDLVIGGQTEYPTLDYRDDIPYRVFFFRGLGDGRFEPMAPPEELVASRRNMASTTFGDYDRDGDLDMFVGYWEIHPTGGEENQLWENTGGGRFVRAHRRLGLGGQFQRHVSFSPNFADANGDGWPDLLIVGDFETTQLFINVEGTRFENRTDPRILNDENGMGSAIGDYDNDGDLDWFVSSIYDEVEPAATAIRPSWGRSGNRLYENRGDGTFVDVTARAGIVAGFWGWGSCFADFDLDGRLDIFMVNGWGEADSPFMRELAGRFFGTPARLFLATGAKSFIEGAQSAGIADRGEGRAVSCLDYDRDGDVDVVIVNAGQPTRVYRNRLRQRDPGGTHFLGVRLAGIAGNQEAVGARITVETDNGSQTRELRVGSNYLSQDPTEALFGLGSSPRIDTIRVRWPDRAGTVSEHREIEADRWITLSHPERPRPLD